MTTESINLKEKVLKGLELSYQILIKNKIERNLDLVISVNGKVVHIDPKDFLKNKSFKTLSKSSFNLCIQKEITCPYNRFRNFIMRK